MKRSLLIGAALVFSLTAIGCGDDSDDDKVTTDSGVDGGHIDSGLLDGGLDSSTPDAGHDAGGDAR